MRNVCTIDGCNEFCVGRGWCSSHYYRWRRSGSPDFPAKVTECAVDGCGNPGPFTRGWCYRHYSRWYHTGSLEKLVRPGNQACSVCGSPARAKGLCSLHYQRFMNTGDPTTEPKLPPPGTCGVCLSPHRARAEVLLLEGGTFPEVSKAIGISPDVVRHHSRSHLGLDRTGMGARCQICFHPDVDEIEAMIEGRVMSQRAIAERFGLTSRKSIQNHTTPAHQQRRALYELGRLNALKETA